MEPRLTTSLRCCVHRVETMLFLGLIFIAGFDGLLACRRTCAGETIRCAMFHRAVETHRDLAETSEALDKLCRSQRTFYKCMEHARCVSDRISLNHRFPLNVEVARIFVKELCSQGTKLRNDYLEAAPCINNQDTFHCDLNNTFVDDFFNFDSCLFERTRQGCVSNILRQNCGEKSEFIYRKLARVFTGPNNYMRCTEEIEGELVSVSEQFEVERDPVQNSEVRSAAVLEVEDMELLEQVKEDPIRNTIASDQESLDMSSSHDFIEYFEPYFESKPFISEDVLSSAQLSEPEVKLKRVDLKLYAEHQFTIFWNKKEMSNLENITCTKSESNGKLVFICVVKSRIPVTKIFDFSSDSKEDSHENEAYESFVLKQKIPSTADSEPVLVVEDLDQIKDAIGDSKLDKQYFSVSDDGLIPEHSSDFPVSKDQQQRIISAEQRIENNDEAENLELDDVTDQDSKVTKKPKEHYISFVQEREVPNVYAEVSSADSTIDVQSSHFVSVADMDSRVIPGLATESEIQHEIASNRNVVEQPESNVIQEFSSSKIFTDAVLAKSPNNGSSDSLPNPKHETGDNTSFVPSDGSEFETEEMAITKSARSPTTVASVEYDSFPSIPELEENYMGSSVEFSEDIENLEDESHVFHPTDLMPDFDYDATGDGDIAYSNPERYSIDVEYDSDLNDDENALEQLSKVHIPVLEVPDVKANVPQKKDYCNSEQEESRDCQPIAKNTVLV